MRVTQAGDWERKTDQAIRETSMAREVKADSETRELVSRTTTIKATDKTTVLGTASLMAGAVQQNPIGIGAQCVRAAAMALQGLPVPPVIDTGFIWADASNIDSPEVVAVLYQ